MLLLPPRELLYLTPHESFRHFLATFGCDCSVSHSLSLFSFRNTKKNENFKGGWKVARKYTLSNQLAYVNLIDTPTRPNSKALYRCRVNVFVKSPFRRYRLVAGCSEPLKARLESFPPFLEYLIERCNLRFIPNHDPFTPLQARPSSVR